MKVVWLTEDTRWVVWLLFHSLYSSDKMPFYLLHLWILLVSKFCSLLQPTAHQ